MVIYQAHTLGSRRFDIVRSATLPGVISWLLVLVFSLFFYALTAASPLLGETSWPDAARIATGLWLTSYGGQMELSGSTLGVIPGSLLLANMFALYRSARSARIGQVYSGSTDEKENYALHALWVQLLLFSVVHCAVVGIIGLIVRPPGNWWYAIIGAFIISLIAALYTAGTIVFQPLVPFASLEFIALWAKRVALLCIVIGTGALLVAICCNFPRILDIHQAYLAGVSGGVGLVLVQLLYMPNYVVWAFSWIVGSGFTINDAYFSAYTQHLAPIPALPIFGAIPNNKPWFVVLVAVPIVIFLFLGHAYIRDLTDSQKSSVKEYVQHVILLAGVCGFGSTIAAFAASGTLGSTHVILGVRPWTLMLCTIALIILTFGFCLAWGVYSSNRKATLRERAKSDHDTAHAEKNRMQNESRETGVTNHGEAQAANAVSTDEAGNTASHTRSHDMKST